MSPLQILAKCPLAKCPLAKCPLARCPDTRYSTNSWVNFIGSSIEDGWFCCSGRIPRLSLNQHSLYVGVVEKSPPHHSQESSTERWSRNTLRVVTARVFYVLRGFLTSPFIFNNTLETAVPFNLVSHPRCCEPRN